MSTIYGKSGTIAPDLRVGCEAFLTNDSMLKRVTELSILVLNELEL